MENKLGLQTANAERAPGQSIFLEPKQLYRKLEALFRRLPSGKPQSVAKVFLQLFLEQLAAGLRISGMHLYDRLSGVSQLVCEEGETCENVFSLIPVHAELPWVGFLAGRLSAVLTFGEDATLVLAFFGEKQTQQSSSEQTRAQFSSIFFAMHYALVQHLRLKELHHDFEQSRAIQMSLLPRKTPHFPGFDIAAVTIPAKEVGGDLYDFHLEGPDSLVLSVADAAGHGLPAALQARDVITGLRMGIQTELDLAMIMQRLNTVIHRSGLASRFISLVLGRIYSSGDFVYVNAGHPRPILLGRAGFEELASGGMILGPYQSAQYEAGCVHLDPGDAIVFFTDGVTEHSDAKGGDFGVNEIKSWLQATRHDPADVSLLRLFQNLREFGAGKSFSDDVTVLLLKRHTSWL